MAKAQVRKGPELPGQAEDWLQSNHGLFQGGEGRGLSQSLRLTGTQQTHFCREKTNSDVFDL